MSRAKLLSEKGKSSPKNDTKASQKKPSQGQITANFESHAIPYQRLNSDKPFQND